MTTKFKYIRENGMDLTKSQIDLLTKIENIPCDNILAGFADLTELRKTKGYKVVVSDRMSFIEKIKGEDQAIDNLSNDLKEKSIKGTITEEELAILFKIKKELKDYLERIKPGATTYPLLGLYRNWDFSYNSPVIYLFKENIDDYAERRGKSADNIFAYVHEAMHAYYYSQNSEGGQVVHELEEAFAECGMLEFLTNACFHDKDLCELAIDAYDDVKGKQENGPNEYGFGLYLNESFGEKTADMMSRYREISNWIPDKDVSSYKEKIKELPKKSSLDNAKYEREAQECFKLVEKILNNQYHKPNVDVNPYLEPHMRKNGVTVREDAPATWKHSGKSTSIAASSSIIYSGTPRKIGSSYRQVQIFASEDPTEMAYGILNVANLVGGERAMAQMIYYYDYSYKGIYPDKFHVYSPFCLKRNGNISYILRPLFIGGNPIYIQKGWQLDPETLTAESPSLCLLLDALNAVSDKRFSILNSGKTLVLYGPEDIKDAIESNQQER